MKKILMIIPAYNEEKSIVKTVESINKLESNNYKIDYVVINDGSTDNTKNVCIENKINFIDLPCNLGIGGAVQTGYKYAHYNNYDIAIQFDGDGQHDANYIEKLAANIDEGNSLVIGSRFVAEESEFKSTFIRRVGINFLSGLIKLCTGKKVYDVTSGFRAADKDLIKYFAFNYPIDYPEPDSLVQVIKKGYKVAEVSVKMNERQGGTSSISGLKSAYYMIKVSFAILIANFATKKER